LLVLVRLGFAALALALGVGGVAYADAAADVEAAERAFNAAQNAGNAEGMFKWMLPTRTIFANAEHLGVGWTEQDKQERQAGFDAGRKINYEIREMSVRVYGDTAIATFLRIGSVKNAGEVERPQRLHVTGVWVRQKDGWKLAHRHESLF
jgi:ketosteroid isomerase-like protein